ncbi:hypothetical protein GDO81_007146 [Engystomops pustulosus]|uniref:UBX domain protein 2A n=1 Tax=Engystomops pustulosus TaxID=76066 RepID=A0AAV7C547_ENGPU|nr:hypothetical protein GDO81_007146 [Engystomops pustulosus]
MREADKTDAMKPQDRVLRMGRSSSERRRCDSFVNSLFEEAEDAGVLNASPEDEVRQEVVALYSYAQVEGFPFVDREEAEVVIKMWKNGFTINDGQLRDYTDSANRQFMDSMRKGATPKVITKATDGDEESLPTVQLNPQEPLTKVKIWLHDGKRIVQEFNTTHRISDVRSFVEGVPCKAEKMPFILATSFPLRDLLDEAVTLQDAGLQNAVLVQRLQKISQPFRDT